ncbi:MAG: putative toxin-antitoxin system toxin component, PIN family [Pirellulales bacterium]
MASDLPHHFVLDVNTIVSAYLFPESIPGQALDFVLGQHRLLMSMDVASELADVVRRQKFDRYLSQRRREELLAGTIRSSDIVDTSITIAVCRDPSDNKLLELAVDGSAAVIVSGDADLLALHPFRGIPILTPRQFLSQFAAS